VTGKIVALREANVYQVNEDPSLMRQTIYYPYSWALRWANGTVLNALVESPTYDVPDLGQVPYLDVAAISSQEDGKISVFILKSKFIQRSHN